ncbi:hypothetical protein ACFOZ7_01720 [Natribaculum luteum]|uniref:MYM-type domain-containing protein n=1 Tax=Natribaculum luteum TaxID=1586232 RepID=A0ABD5NVB1_9EURY|nr:hypothetical protein [Natribaculum luteum]
MKCDNCASGDEIAYTLTTYVEDEPNEHVELHFCSTECLRVWT